MSVQEMFREKFQNFALLEEEKRFFGCPTDGTFKGSL